MTETFSVSKLLREKAAELRNRALGQDRDVLAFKREMETAEKVAAEFRQAAAECEKVAEQLEARADNPLAAHWRERPALERAPAEVEARYGGGPLYCVSGLLADPDRVKIS